MQRFRTIALNKSVQALVEYLASVFHVDDLSVLGAWIGLHSDNGDIAKAIIPHIDTAKQYAGKKLPINVVMGIMKDVMVVFGKEANEDDEKDADFYVSMLNDKLDDKCFADKLDGMVKTVIAKATALQKNM